MQISEVCAASWDLIDIQGVLRFGPINHLWQHLGELAPPLAQVSWFIYAWPREWHYYEVWPFGVGVSL